MGEYRREVQRQNQIWRRLNKKWGRAKELRAPNLTIGGNAATEVEAAALTSVESLDVQQRPVVIGTPVPMVWGYGIWVSPPAIRWAYRNNRQDITSVHVCSLGEGAIERIDEVYWGGVKLSSLSGGRWTYRTGSLPAWDFSSNITKQTYSTKVTTKQNIKFGGDYYYASGATKPSGVGTYGVTFGSSSDRCTRLWATVTKVGHYTEYYRGTYWSSTGNVTYSSFKTKYQHGGTWDLSSADSSGNARSRSITVWNKNRFKNVLKTTEYDKDFETVDDWILEINERFEQDYPTPIPPLSGGGGGGGSLQSLGIITAEVTTPIEDQRYLHQLHIKVGAGVQRSRLRGDGSVGASQNYADLVWTLLKEGSLVPNSLIDTGRLTTAARFTAANGLNYNGVVADPANISDFIAQTGILFLCGMTMHGGRVGLQPLLPYNGAYQITTGYTVRKTLTQGEIVSGTYERQYVPLADRKLPMIQATWKTHNPVGGKTRVREIRYAGTAGSGPYETHDWSSFCTSREQAEKIARYLLARRKHITHTVTFEVALPDAAGLVPGDVIKVDRWSDSSIDSAITETDHYQIDVISAAQTGRVRIEGTHFPVSGSVSLVARDVLTPSYFQYG